MAPAAFLLFASIADESRCACSQRLRLVEGVHKLVDLDRCSLSCMVLYCAPKIYWFILTNDCAVHEEFNSPEVVLGKTLVKR